MLTGRSLQAMTWVCEYDGLARHQQAACNGMHPAVAPLHECELARCSTQQAEKGVSVKRGDFARRLPRFPAPSQCRRCDGHRPRRADRASWSSVRPSVARHHFMTILHRIQRSSLQHERSFASSLISSAIYSAIKSCRPAHGRCMSQHFPDLQPCGQPACSCLPQPSPRRGRGAAVAVLV